MQLRFLVFILTVLLTSCFLLKDYKPSRFSYTQEGQAASIPLVIPRGYVKEERKDTAGITLQTYRYPGGALLYAAYLTDTLVQLQPFDTSLHQPRVHRLGGLVYKGQDENELFYREIRQGHLRFGYRLVPEAHESLFDSATNFASLQPH